MGTRIAGPVGLRRTAMTPRPWVRGGSPPTGRGRRSVGFAELGGQAERAEAAEREGSIGG